VRYLIVSDIHANWEALQAVLQQAAGEYDLAVCCGDLVGYGADPNPVVQWVRSSCVAVVRGNHDKACAGMDDLEWFNPVARTAALWTQERLGKEEAEYIRQLPKGPVRVDGFHLVHGSPYDEDEYVVNAQEAAQAFGYIEGRVTLFGHTHVQGGFLWNHSRVETLIRIAPRVEEQKLRIDEDCAYLINPGSVGQPRDGDPRAAYVLYDTEARELTYRRTKYDMERAQEKIVQAGLPPILAERLGLGR
jgi:predicted phosphodiesterase